MGWQQREIDKTRFNGFYFLVLKNACILIESKEGKPVCSGERDGELPICMHITGAISAIGEKVTRIQNNWYTVNKLLINFPITRLLCSSENSVQYVRTVLP